MGCKAYHAMPLDPEAVRAALAPPSAAALRIQASELHHPALAPIAFDERNGLSPDEAAVLAVLLNPELRAERARRRLARAQLLEAGLLPNPTMLFGMDFPIQTGGGPRQTVRSAVSDGLLSGVESGLFGSSSGSSGGSTGGGAASSGGPYVNAYSFGLEYDIRRLITRRPRIKQASEHLAAVELDVAWREWQKAQAARTAVYAVVALDAQAALAQQMRERLQENLKVVRQAVNLGLMTELDLSAAETASSKAESNLLMVQKKAAERRLALKQTLGLPPNAAFTLEPDIELPTHYTPPSLAQLTEGLQQRRLDLVGLRRGYESQEAAVRLAVLRQFPKIIFGGNRARDTSDVQSLGMTFSLDLPIFDHNQGQIAIAEATRQRLFDEYVTRVFQARADIATHLADIESVNAQIRTAEKAVPKLEKLVDTYRRAVDIGQADVLSYYTAWNDLTQKRLDVLQYKQMLMHDRIALELAAGIYGPEVSARTLQEERGGTSTSRQPATNAVRP